MQTWSITLHGPAGVISTVDTGESQFVIGTETASDVFTVQGEGVTARHAWVWISEARIRGQGIDPVRGVSKVTGKEWRLPTNAEWEAAVGTTMYPWGDYYPPKWDDGNYAILEDGKDDPQRVGVDGIKGTAPVGSFKPNALGFYDLGGNATEWMWDGQDEKTRNRVFRGASWYHWGGNSRSAARPNTAGAVVGNDRGLRLVRRSGSELIQPNKETP